MAQRKLTQEVDWVELIPIIVGFWVREEYFDGKGNLIELRSLSVDEIQQYLFKKCSISVGEETVRRCLTAIEGFFERRNSKQ